MNRVNPEGWWLRTNGNSLIANKCETPSPSVSMHVFCTQIPISCKNPFFYYPF